MFKCKKCKKTSRPGETQFKKMKSRIYLTEDGKKAKQFSEEKIVCCKCFKKEEK